jgi:hypothetical protein
MGCGGVNLGGNLCLLLVQIGVDPKAVSEAWNGIQKKHGEAAPAALFVSVDEDKGKALALAGGTSDSLMCPAPLCIQSCVIIV